MRSIEPIPTQHVPVIDHTCFPRNFGEPREYGPAQKHVEGNRSHPLPNARCPMPTDSYQISPEALRAHRAQYEAADMHLCPDCELVHGKGSCPLDEPIEERSDWGSPVDPAYQRALWVTVAALIGIILVAWYLGR